MTDIQFDIFSFIFFFFIGGTSAWWFMWPKRKTVITEVKKDVVQCRQCNAMRREIERRCLMAEKDGSRYALPMVGTGKNRRVFWEQMDIAPQVGNKKGTAARYIHEEDAKK